MGDESQNVAAVTRAVTVPQYTRNTALRTNVYALSATAGGAGNAGTRLHFSSQAASGDYFTPQQAVSASGIGLHAVGTSQNEGWELDAPPNANDQTTFEAGTFTLTVRYARESTLGHVDRPGRLTWVLFVRGSDGSVKSEVGRVQSAALTFTTAIQSVALSIVTVDPLVLAAGDRLYFDMYLGTTLAVGLTSHCSFRTEAATESRITAIPSYTTQFGRVPSESPAVSESIARSSSPTRALADSPVVTDALPRAKSLTRSLDDSAPSSDVLARLATYLRVLPDSASATDALTRQGVFARSMLDSSALTDALTRLFTGARALVDSAPSSDVLARLATLARALADSSAVTDALARQGTFARSLADTAPAADSLARLGTFGRALSDSAPVVDALARVKSMVRPLNDSPNVVDALARLFTGSRALADSATVTDSLNRLITLGRFLEDNLGSATIVNIVRRIRRLVVDD